MSIRMLGPFGLKKKPTMKIGKASVEPKLATG